HLGDVAVGEAHRDVGLVDEHVAELGVRVDGAVDPLEDDGLLEPLPSQLGRQEDLGHAAVRDPANDVVSAVLRHPLGGTFTTVHGAMSVAGQRCCGSYPAFRGRPSADDSSMKRRRARAKNWTGVLSGVSLLSEMSNNAPSDNIVLRQAVEQIQRSLPGHWTTTVAMKTNDVADARLTIKTPAGATAALAIGARRQLDPRLVPEVADALRTAAADAAVLIAPFLGPRTRERLAEEGIGYVDLCGNMRLVLDRPTVFISTRGDASSPWAAPRSSRSLHAPKACRI